jgi:hypothetical protein
MLIAVIVSLSAAAASMPAPTRISARDLAEPMEYACGHINGSLKGAPLALMRPVQIAAGSLVLLGSERT